jgi:addiction module RelE/StbE family toxin
MQVKTTKDFDKQYSRLNQKTKQQFMQRLDLFIANPFNPILRNHPLKGKYRHCHSINVTGDVRAVYTVKDASVVFGFIGTHSQLY